jgi:hypothetical protein
LFFKGCAWPKKLDELESYSPPKIPVAGLGKSPNIYGLG